MSGATNTESTSPPSKDEILLDGLRRIKTHSQAYLLPRLIMTQQLHQMMVAARQRTADAHRHIQNLMGEPVGEDEDGNISLQGDTTIHHHASEGIASKLLPIALAAGIGAAALPLWSWWNKSSPVSPPAVTTPSQQDDWKLGLEVKDTP